MECLHVFGTVLARKIIRWRGRKKNAIAYSHHAHPGATYFYDGRARARTLSRAASWNILFTAHPSADETGWRSRDWKSSATPMKESTRNNKKYIYMHTRHMRGTHLYRRAKENVGFKYPRFCVSGPNIKLTKKVILLSSLVKLENQNS